MRSSVRSRLAPPAFASYASYGFASQPISEGWHAEARRAEAGGLVVVSFGSASQLLSRLDHRNHIVRENIVPQFLALTRAIDCVISDIVKRRSIRVGSCINSCATLHNLQVISAL